MMSEKNTSYHPSKDVDTALADVTASSENPHAMPPIHSVRDLRNAFHLFWKPLVSVLVWGLSFIATKYALAELDPVTIINIRLGLSIPLLGLGAYITGKSFRIQKKQIGLVALLATISVIHLTIQVTGLRYTSAANTGWIIGTSPIFIAVMGRIFLKERISRQQTWGILVSLAGLVLLISKGNLTSLSFIKGIGDLLILASCATWGIFSVINRKLSLNYSPLITTFYLFVFMAVITLPFNINSETFNAVLHLSTRGWTALLFLGLFCSGLGYALWAKALSEMPSANVAAFLNIEPFITFIGAWLILGEHITLITIVSGLVIMFGIGIVNIRRR
jgi:drug/metabolite transporter (DMT)-like permease